MALLRRSVRPRLLAATSRRLAVKSHFRDSLGVCKSCTRQMRKRFVYRRSRDWHGNRTRMFACRETARLARLGRACSAGSAGVAASYRPILDPGTEYGYSARAWTTPVLFNVDGWPSICSVSSPHVWSASMRARRRKARCKAPFCSAWPA